MMLNNTNLALVASTSKREIDLYTLLDEYLITVSKESAKSISYYIGDFKKFLENKYISNVTVNDIQRYINYKSSLNLKDTTIYRYYRMLKTIFNYAVSHEYIEKNPCVRR